MLRVFLASSHSLPVACTHIHTPSPVHKGSLSCSAQPCNVCERQELPYSHSLNRLLSPSWLGGCSHSCFNPWEQRHDSKQLFTHWSGLPPATSSFSSSPPFFLVCWVRICLFVWFFFFMYSFLIQAATKTLLHRISASPFHSQRNAGQISFLLRGPSVPQVCLSAAWR